MFESATPLCVRPSLGTTPIFGHLFNGCSFFAYSWKLPAYSGDFLLMVVLGAFFAYNWSMFAYSWSFFTDSWSFCVSEDLN